MSGRRWANEAEGRSKGKESTTYSIMGGAVSISVGVSSSLDSWMDEHVQMPVHRVRL